MKKGGDVLSPKTTQLSPEALIENDLLDPIQVNLTTVSNIRRLIAERRDAHDLGKQRASRKHMAFLIPCVVISASLSVCSLVLPAEVISPVSGVLNVVVTVLTGLMAQFKYESKANSHDSAMRHLNRLESALLEFTEKLNVCIFGMKNDRSAAMLTELLMQFPGMLENMYKTLEDIETEASCDESLKRDAKALQMKRNEPDLVRDESFVDTLKRNSMGQVNIGVYGAWDGGGKREDREKRKCKAEEAEVACLEEQSERIQHLSGDCRSNPLSYNSTTATILPILLGNKQPPAEQQRVTPRDRQNSTEKTTTPAQTSKLQFPSNVDEQEKRGAQQPMQRDARSRKETRAAAETARVAAAEAEHKAVEAEAAVAEAESELAAVKAELVAEVSSAQLPATESSVQKPDGSSFNESIDLEIGEHKELQYLNKQIKHATDRADLCPKAKADLEALAKRDELLRFDLEALEKRDEFLRRTITNQKPVQEKISILQNSKNRAVAKFEKSQTLAQSRREAMQSKINQHDVAVAYSRV